MEAFAPLAGDALEAGYGSGHAFVEPTLTRGELKDPHAELLHPRRRRGRQRGSRPE